MRAASTTNQSDIRGLVRPGRTRADRETFRREPGVLQTRVRRPRPPVAKGGTPMASIVPAPQGRHLSFSQEHSIDPQFSTHPGFFAEGAAARRPQPRDWQPTRHPVCAGLRTHRCRTGLEPMEHRPDKSRQFPHHRHHRLRQRLAPLGQMFVPFVQPQRRPVRQIDRPRRLVRTASPSACSLAAGGGNASPDSVSSRRTRRLPVLVIPPVRRLSPLECSDGVTPRYAINARGLENRPKQ